MREQGAGVGSECCCDIAMRRKQCRSNDVFDGMAKMGGKGHEESSSWGVPVAANGDGVAPIPAMI